eukprot:3224896-Prymnesium_polylepis.1
MPACPHTLAFCCLPLASCWQLDRAKTEITTLDRRVNEARAAEREARAQAAANSLEADDLSAQVASARAEVASVTNARNELRKEVDELKAKAKHKEK